MKVTGLNLKAQNKGSDSVPPFVQNRNNIGMDRTQTTGPKAQIDTNERPEFESKIQNRRCWGHRSHVRFVPIAYEHKGKNCTQNTQTYRITIY